MESSEVVREKEHPFAKKRWIIAVTLVVLTVLCLFLRSFRRKPILFFTRYCNRDTR